MRTQISLPRRAMLYAALALVVAFSASASADSPKGEPITIGVSGPLTGQNAQYGAQWKKGFDLALDEVNGAGGVKGRPLQYVSSRTARPTRARRWRSRRNSSAIRRSSSRSAISPAPPRWRPRRSTSAPASCSSASPTRIRISPRAATSSGATRSARRTSSRGSPNMPPTSASRSSRCSISTPIGAAPARRSSREAAKALRRSRSSPPRATSPTRRISARPWCACATPSPTGSS